MSDARRRPAAVLEYSEDLVSADVAPLRAFLEARIAEATVDMTEGGRAHMALQALAAHVTMDCVDLCDCLSAWERYVAQGRAHRPGHIQALHQDISRRWNLLCRTAEGWGDHPGHNPRWRQLPYACAADQEFMESVLAERKGASRGPYERGAHP